MYVAYRRARARGLGITLDNNSTLSQSDPRAAIELMKVQYWRELDPERAKKTLVDLERSKIAREKDKVDLGRAKNEAKIVEHRLAVQEQLAKKAAAKDEGLIFGLTSIIGDEELTVATRTEIAQWCVRKGIIAVRRADLVSDPKPQSAEVAP